MDLSKQIEEAIKRGKKPFAPQPGFQMNYLTSSADIVLGGGAAGAGKTTSLILAASRYHQVKNYGAVIFRKTIPEILQEGGLWDEAMAIYPRIGGVPNITRHLFRFPDYLSKISFAHLGNENDLGNFQGSQIPFIAFDELTHFTKKMFIYMLSRNRSARCKVEPRIYATMNPDPDSWVAEFIAWFIDQETGFPIPERAGKIRYFMGEQDSLIQGETREEVLEKVKYIFDDPMFKDTNPDDLIKSFTFIPGLIGDNQILLKENPGYLANLKAQDEETQLRLLYGNWKIRSDKTSLIEYLRISDMFTNQLPEFDAFGKKIQAQKNYIVIDHARFGRDLCVIGTWQGWKCIRIDILTTSDTNDILHVVGGLRRRYNIPSSQVLIDQDGIGVKDNLQCRIFQGNGAARDEKVDQKTVKSNYKNRRAQNYFLLAKKINAAEISIDLNNVWLHKNQVEFTQVKVIKVGGVSREIKDMVRDDLRTIKRKNPDSEGKVTISMKEEIKAAIGRSPDFGDMLMMRCEFEFVKDMAYLR